MHPDISAFTNHYIYHDLVGDHPIVKESRNHIVDSGPFAGQASVLIDTSFSGENCGLERGVTFSNQSMAIIAFLSINS